MEVTPAKKHTEITLFLEAFASRKSRTIVIVDYGNVEKWKRSLQWKVDIRKLALLIKHLSVGRQFLRRFYYGADYGEHEKSVTLSQWSSSVFDRADMNRFEVIQKRVKYIRTQNNPYGYEKKCDLDVEMAVDLIKEQDNYDTIVLFSGDGDLMYAVQYLHETYNKHCIVFSARGHIGREVVDGIKNGFVEKILYAEDFEYRLSGGRWNGNTL